MPDIPNMASQNTDIPRDGHLKRLIQHVVIDLRIDRLALGSQPPSRLVDQPA
jgi:hypothetical protein